MQTQRLAVVAVVAVAMLTACPKRTTRGLAEYQLDADQGYLGGKVIAVEQAHVLNRRDFVYSIAFDATTRRVAFPHMVMTDFEVSLADVETGKVLWHAPLNPTEFDVEGVSFVGGKSVAVAVGVRRSATSTHPALRLFDAATGDERAFAFSDDEKGYTQIAASRDGRLIAAVTSKDGNLVIADGGSLAWLGEARAHRGPATAVAFAADGTIYTGGQDCSIAVWRLQPTPPSASGEVRLPLVLVGAAKEPAIQVYTDRRLPALLSITNAIEETAVTRAWAQRAGIAVGAPTRKVRTHAGEVTVAEVTLPPLALKDVALAGVPAVVCDECVPVGCDGIVGADQAQRLHLTRGPLPYLVTLAIDSASSAPVEPAPKTQPPPATDKPAGAAGDTMPAVAFELLRPELVSRIELPGSVNDIRLSRDGRQLCVATSSEPAERTLPLYEAEKAGKYPAPSPKNAALLVDVASGQVVKSFVAHRGYVVTADLSPDGRTLVSGGWDNRVLLFDVESGALAVEQRMAWLVRRVRFGADGRSLGVAAWTPPSRSGGDSDPAAVVFDLVYQQPTKFSN